MLCDTHYGEIADKYLHNWNPENTEINNPFDLLKERYKISFPDTWTDFLYWANSNLPNKINVDWGSFAWKCFGKDLLKIKQDFSNTTIENCENIKPDGQYGLVFIELS